MTPEQKQVWDMHESGMSLNAISREIGKARSTVQRLYHRAKLWNESDSALKQGAKSIGADTPARVVWTKTHKDGSVTHSVLHVKSDTDEEFIQRMAEAVSNYKPLDRDLFAPRVNVGAKGDHILIVDPADVHFGKLCDPDETGNTYNIEVARHRMIEGTRELIRKTKDEGIDRILFVVGNDILHTDNGKTSTSGTPQDMDGTFFTMSKAAEYATIDAISECALVADTDLIHNMSNHDWRSGWMLANIIAASMKNHEGVRATEYNMSPRHRKYYGYHNSGMVFTHGDGAKEEVMLGLFLKEARKLAGGCDHLYAYLHHLHHKIKKRRGILGPIVSEKDHVAMTSITTGSGRDIHGDLEMEWVRSPSAPDGWHDRNGYKNRQAVECFLHHKVDGQVTRKTEWF